MAKYYVDIKSQADGRHRVHTEDCPLVPLVIHRLPLGEQRDSISALVAASRYYPNNERCDHCARSDGI